MNTPRTAKAAAPELKERRPGYGRKMTGFSYVYILKSETYPARFYVGLTDDLADRLRRHNAGDVPHTAKSRPWRIKTAVAFDDRGRAAEFEAYLKTGSGRAFAKKHL